MFSNLLTKSKSSHLQTYRGIYCKTGLRKKERNNWDSNGSFKCVQKLGENLKQYQTTIKEKKQANSHLDVNF
jgi:hypothetical protein